MIINVDIIENESDKPLKIITIDNFYENPKAVRNLILSTPHIRKRNDIGPSWRCMVAVNMGNVREKLAEVINNEFGDGLKKTVLHQSNLCDTLVSNYFPSCPQDFIDKNMDIYDFWKVRGPHCDDNSFACSIWLNDDKYCKGGTGFYQNIENGLVQIPEKWDIENNMSQNIEYYSRTINQESSKKSSLSGTDEFWRLYHVSKMKFNRATIYDGHFYHAAFWKKGWFTDSGRISQVHFFRKRRHQNIIKMEKMG